MSFENSYPFIGSCKLQDFCNGSEVPSLVVRKPLAGTDVNNVKRIRRHNGRVDVSVIQQVAYDLESGKTISKLLFENTQYQREKE